QAVHAGSRVRVIPITYVNSTAAVKAFVGERGGACCTSGNAREVFEWAMQGGDTPLAKGERVQMLFMPDQHLGRNTARLRGLKSELDAERGQGTADMAVWNPKKPRGGLSEQVIRDATVLLWAGHCSVHKLFRPEHVAQARDQDPGTTVIVHPECWPTRWAAPSSSSSGCSRPSPAAAGPSAPRCIWWSACAARPRHAACARAFSATASACAPPWCASGSRTCCGCWTTLPKDAW
ncbi:MAG: hypothetical protein EBR71_09970, partial [Planctomycetes bacterium]|nr:hypothetical protein [Planctomycetota bacterium]